MKQICSHCGKQFDGNFCPACGAPAVCPSCGAPVGQDATFCAKCGAVLSAPTENAAPMPADKAPKPAEPAPQGAGQPNQSGEPKNAAIAARITRWNTRRTITASILCSVFFPPIIILIMVCAGALSGPQNENWAPTKLGRERRAVLGTTIANAVLFAASLAGSIVFAVLGKYALAVASGTFIFGIQSSDPIIFPILAAYLFFVVFLYAIGALLGINALSICKQLTQDFFGKPDPIYEADTPLITVQEVNKDAALAKRGLIASPRIPKDYAHISAVVLSFLYIAIAALSIWLVGLNDKFTISKVEKIALGNTKDQVESVLGAPYAAPGSQQSDARSSSVWEYYSDSYVSLQNREFDLIQQAAEAFLKGDLDKIDSLNKESEKLEEQAASLVYQYIRVDFNSDDKVVSVLLDTKRQSGEHSKNGTGVENHTLSRTTFADPTQLNDLTAKVEYADGSYYRGRATVVEIKNSYLVWSDGFGTQFTEYSVSFGWDPSQSS